MFFPTPRSAVLILLALTACKSHGIDDTDGSGDTDGLDTDTTVPADDRAALFTAVHQPPMWWQTVSGWAESNGATDCPSITAIDDTHWQMDGDCTADGVAYTGDLVWLDGPQGQRVLFEAFGVDDLVYDGEILVFTDGHMQADYAARGADDTIVYAYSQMQFTLLADFLSVFVDLHRGSYTMAGRFTIAGSGIHDVTATVTDSGDCTLEPDEGTLDMAGADPITFTYNGAAICDGCVPYVDDFGTGEVCPW